jgi:hypothetical protein
VRHRPIDRIALLKAINQFWPKWLGDARKETAVDRAAGRQKSEDALWSKIKPVFRKHQREKCAYCERILGEGAVEWDVEHFRPKRRVDEWSSTTFPEIGTGGEDARGYFLLAFEPRNYLASCKTCNSTFKKNFFPIAGERMLSVARAEDARDERAFLLNPLDPDDPPPESLIGYHGVAPQIVATRPEDRQRAAMTIEVLGLAAREDLHRVRAETIMAMRLALDKLTDPSESERSYAREVLGAMTAPGARMSSCAVAFRELYQDDPEKARELSLIATRYVHSQSR